VESRIAILGWGSLVWDVSPQFAYFHEQHEEWLTDGPAISLEFSRVSETRDDALTLVIDPKNGAPCRVAYALSKRNDLNDAICDLRSREGTIHKRIGVVRSLDPVTSGETLEMSAIKGWARSKGLFAVVWTDLPSNFDAKVGKPFSVDNALGHIRSLSAEGKAKAAEYVWRAPTFIDTPLRRALQAEPWFAHNPNDAR